MKAPTWQKTKTQFLLRNSESGVYYARLYWNGKQIWKSLKTDVYSVAQAHLDVERQALRQSARADKETEKAQTFSDLTSLYLHAVQIDPSIKKSMKRYRSQCVDAITRFGSDMMAMAPRSITESQCEEFAARCSEHYSAPRYNNAIDTLRLIFGLGIKKGLLFRNPAEDLSKRKPQPKFLILPTSEQFNQIVAIARKSGAWCQTQAGDMIEFLAYSGCRLDESKYVKWSDVNGDTIWIHGGDEGTKNKERRQIPIIPQMRTLLDDLRENPRYFRGDREGYVLSCRKCNEALDTACKAIGFTPKLTHHSLRHLFATRCIESGVDIPTVARWMGHKDGGALAMRTYGHLRNQHSQDMALKVKF
jgi:integrase